MSNYNIKLMRKYDVYLKTFNDWKKLKTCSLNVINIQGTYEYGCQLVNVALSLRQSCKLPIDTNTALSHELWRTWKRLYSVGQEQMTRLRVSAVFHRSVHQVATVWFYIGAEGIVCQPHLGL